MALLQSLPSVFPLFTYALIHRYWGGPALAPSFRGSDWVFLWPQSYLPEQVVCRAKVSPLLDCSEYPEPQIPWPEGFKSDPLGLSCRKWTHSLCPSWTKEWPRGGACIWALEMWAGVPHMSAWEASVVKHRVGDGKRIGWSGNPCWRGPTWPSQLLGS